MRRDAKASTAGPTHGWAVRLGHPLREAVTARRAAPGVTGSGASAAGRLAPTAILAALLGGLTLMLALLASAPPKAQAADCPNEIRRQEQGVAALQLPDCRAYEVASPGSQPHASSSGGTDPGRSSTSGNHIQYNSKYPALGENDSGQEYLSVRGPNGWAPRTIIPQMIPDTQGTFACNPAAFFSPDFSKMVLEQDHEEYEPPEPNAGNPEGFCTRSEELLDPREEIGYRTLVLQDMATNLYELVELNPEGGAPGNAYTLDASDDFSRIFFKSEGQLTPEAPGVTPEVEGSYNLFVWSGGVVRLASFLPDGTPVQADPVGSPYLHMAAADGSSFVFRHGGNLYVRINPEQPQSAVAAEECTEPTKACTLQVDKSQGPGASGGGFFEFASEDGSKVFFTSDSKLTADSTAEAEKEDLYEFDLLSGELTDLTVNAAEPAKVWDVAAFSEDGSHIYFVAEAALDAGALPGDCANYNEGATCNLYHLNEGSIEFVAALLVDDIVIKFGSGQFKYDGKAVVPRSTGVGSNNSQASPAGRYLGFASYESLTGYDNTNPDTGNPTRQLFLYDSVAETLDCVSCPHPGAPAAAGNLSPTSRPGDLTTDLRKNQVTDSGQFFYDTPGAVLPSDVNETNDVYAWSEGVAHLITSGTDPHFSDFVDASPDGADIFFITAEGILASDVDAATSMYTARVGGGFPEPPPLPGCEGEACRGQGTSAPAAAATGTAAFQGPGNLKQQHRRDCRLVAKRAQRLSRVAKRLRRRARRASGARRTRQLRRRSVRFAKQGKRISRNAKRCRRANRRASR